jgi:hypothetical protein
MGSLLVASHDAQRYDGGVVAGLHTEKINLVVTFFDNSRYGRTAKEVLTSTSSVCVTYALLRICASTNCLPRTFPYWLSPEGYLRNMSQYMYLLWLDILPYKIIFAYLADTADSEVSERTLEFSEWPSDCSPVRMSASS